MPYPNLTEEEIKAAFIRMVNKLSAERGTILAELREIQQTYSGADDLKKTLRELNLQLNREADVVQDLIAENARVAQDQDAYNARYDELVARYEATKERRDKVAAEIRQKGIRRREFTRFIAALENLPEEVTEFEEAMWSSLVDHMVAYSKDDIRFILLCGTEIRI